MTSPSQLGPPVRDPPPATYKVGQAAEIAQISVRQLWRLIDAGKVPGIIRLGRIVRLSKKQFDDWIERGCK